MSETCEQMTLWIDAGRSTSSPVDSRARTSASPAEARGSRSSRGAASRSATSSGSREACDRLGSLLRTSLLCELAASIGCSGSWNDSGTPLQRSWWVLATSARPIDDNASGSSAGWPTPTTRDWKEHGHEPAAQSRKSPCLPAAVVLAGRQVPDMPNTNGSSPDWPTPRAIDGRSKGNGPRPDTLTGRVNYDAMRRRIGSLNHRWVAQLQGMPPDWTDLPAEVLSRLTATATRPTSLN